jgi:xylulokinase
VDLLVGVDLGTTACKVTVVASDLTASSISSPPYPIAAPHREWAEQDPRAWGEAVDTTVQRALGTVGASSRDHVTLSITGQMHSLVLLDADGNPVRPAILWADRRATAECAMIENQVPDVVAITGNPPLPAFTLPQLLWVRRHEPDVLSRSSHVLLPKDYLRWRYTGRVVTDWTDASGTGMLDSATREWSTTILSALDIDPELLPPVADPISDGGVVDGGASPALQKARTAVVLVISSPKPYRRASPMPAIWRSYWAPQRSSWAFPTILSRLLLPRSV